jgi:hypothetical protein
MKRWLLVLSASLVSIIACSPAQAGYQIIRWTSGYCQIVDQASQFKPFSNDYKTGRKTFRSFGEATTVRAKLMAQRQCW